MAGEEAEKSQPDDHMAENGKTAEKTGEKKKSEMKREKTCTTINAGFRRTPEEQDLAYELKAQMMRNLDIQNAKLKTELTLHQRLEESKLLYKRNRKLQDESNMSRVNAIKLMKMYERKANIAYNKLDDLEKEMVRTQELATRVSHELEASQAGQEQRSSPRNEKSEGKKTPPSTSPHHKHTTPIRPEDVKRKNEILLADNDKLRIEIQRLKRDNAELIKKAKHAQSDRDQALHALGTSEAARSDLMKRLDKERKSKKKLDTCITRQASEWIQNRKTVLQLEEEDRFDSVNAVPPLGADKRTYVHPTQKNVYQPRKMVPVQDYSSANQGNTDH
ncbi:unnamed protein product [Owenia fusiformis]|uniref:Uncharacterized protein n=1 Tax=Owenia fusiformis TaxID=6347 RepID=A0A8S4NSR8_OWEFU|nr:unnamed protein product [Owenia fusiformis]